jgi:hypothetical protein
MALATIKNATARLKAELALRTGERNCPACKDWPSEYILEIREVIVDSREQADLKVKRMSEHDDWLHGCPQCGFKPVLAAIEHEKEEDHGETNHNPAP